MTVHCPYCNGELDVETEWIGRKALCRYCNQHFIIGQKKATEALTAEEANKQLALGESYYSGERRSRNYAEEAAPYCVVNLSSGPSAQSYPVSYLDEVPSGGWPDEHKTTKLVLRRIEPGTFTMGDSDAYNNKPHEVTLTKPYYIGVFEVTQTQYLLITDDKPSEFAGRTRPVERVSYDMIRGVSAGAQWPHSSAVDTSSFLGKLRARTGIDFDLPTEAQWEHACRAGTNTKYYWGDSMDGDYCWYRDNSGKKTHPVGAKKPNAWGLYDMSGNVWEWCLDWHAADLTGGLTDPAGSCSGSGRVFRGGSWYYDARYCASSYRFYDFPSSEDYDYGFRLVRTLSD